MIHVSQGLLWRVKEVLSTLQELRSRKVYNDKEEEHPSDVAFSHQAECVVQACEDLSQQVHSKSSVIWGMEVLTSSLRECSCEPGLLHYNCSSFTQDNYMYN